MQYMPEKRDRAAGDALLCPMPGLVVDVPVQKGERVFRGQSLVILESMKMESGVPSPIDGVVAEVLVKPGQAVEADDIDLAEKRNVMDCFECGACTFVCPAHRPLVQHHRRAKAIIMARRRAAQAAARK